MRGTQGPALLALLLLGSCTRLASPDGPTATAPPAGRAPVMRSEPPGRVLPLSGSAALGPSIDDGVPPGESQAAATARAAIGHITLNFTNTDIRTVIAKILGDTLRVSYVIDPSVRGSVTLRMATPITRDAVIPTLQTLLAACDAVLTQSNGMYRIMPAAPASIPAIVANDALGGAIVLALHHASAPQLAAMLQSYVAKGGSIIADAGSNALVIRGDPGSRNALATLVQDFDVDEPAHQSYALFPAAAGNAKSVSQAFTAALREGGRATESHAVTVVPLTSLSAVLVITPMPAGLTNARRIYQLLTHMQDQAARSWHVFPLRYSRADETANLLQQAFTPDHVAALPVSPGDMGANAPGLQIMPDLQNNAVLAFATPAEDAQIAFVLAKLDIAPPELWIDATIAEVDLTGTLQYGTQFFFKSGGINAVLSNGPSSALATSFPGFVLSGHHGDAAPFAISALQAATKVQVLAAPELLLMDGHAATLHAGSLVPYLTQTSQSTDGSAAVNSVAYRQTGVILRVTPYIGDGGRLVTLDIDEENSGVSPVITTPGLNSPTFIVRAVTSRITIQDGQTLGLAGLISDTDLHENQGLPFLKNLPLLGALFRSQGLERSRQEILVLITPHVMGGQQQALDLAADLEEHLPRTASTSMGMQALPPVGAARADAGSRIEPAS